MKPRLNPNIHAICDACGSKFYPEQDHIEGRLEGITVAEGTCDICAAEGMTIPVRDFEFAIGTPGYDWD